MAWKPKEDIQARNRKMRREFSKGVTREALAKKYNMTVHNVYKILRKDTDVKRKDDRVNSYSPISLQPGQVVKLKVGDGERYKIRKYKVIKSYTHQVLMERKGIKECFTYFDIWQNIVK